MDLHLREFLESLAERLHLHDGTGADETTELGERVRSANEADDYHGLADALTEGIVHFEADHPDLAALVRQAVDRLSAAGI